MKKKTKIHQMFVANAEGDSDELVDPPKVEDKIDVVPHGLSIDSDVIKRCKLFDFPFSLVLFFLYKRARVVVIKREA